MPYDVGLRVHQKRVVQALADIFFFLTQLSVVSTRLTISLSFGKTKRLFPPSRDTGPCELDGTSRSNTRNRSLCVGQTSRSNTRHRSLCVGQNVKTPGPVCWTERQDTGPCVLDRTSRHWALCVGQNVKTLGPVCWTERQDIGLCVLDRTSRHRALCVEQDVNVHPLTISSQHQPHDCQGTVSVIHEIWATQCQFTEHAHV